MKKTILVFGTLFIFFGSKAQSWSLTGNAGTNPSTNFIGTTDNTPLFFRVNNIASGKIDGVTRVTFMGWHSGFVATGLDNTGIGTLALGSANGGQRNTAVGSNAMTYVTGTDNTAIGYNASYNTSSGSYNLAAGSGALLANGTGSGNVALGYNSLFRNTSGGSNLAVGNGALQWNSTGYSNVAVGYGALSENYTGYNNTGIGPFAMERSNGTENVGIGYIALGFNSNGNYNIGIGSAALRQTSGASYNTAVGHNAGLHFNNGYNNVFLGANTDVSGNGFYNVIAIGQSTICTAPSQVTMGNGATNSYRAYAYWTNISDGRFKKNIKEDVPGLDFIVKLRPVTYNLDATSLDAFLHKNVKDSISAEGKAVQVKALKEKEQEIQMGFVAQEVEKTANDMGLKFSVVEAPKNDNDVYGIRYSELVVPLVKAVQEQQEIIKQLQKEVADLKDQADIAVLLRETLVNEKLNAYPNPVANDMTVTVTAKTEGRGTLQIFDSGNQLVKEMSITINKGVNTFGIKLPVLAAGYYTLKVNWGKNTQKQMGFIKAN